MGRRRTLPGVRRLGLGAAGLVVLVLVAQQLVLPGVASRRLRDRLEQRGEVRRVSVSAFPAFKLLWGRADRVEVRMASATLSGAGSFAAELGRAREVGRADIRADVFSVGPLRLRDARITKDGDRLHGEAALTRADLAAAVPVDLGLQPVDAGDGSLTLEGRIGPVSAQARLSAADGALVIAPAGLLGGFAGIRVFDDPRLRVDAVGARERPDGFTLTADGRLTG